MTTLVLASQSPGRRDVLTAAGIRFVAHVSGVDEDAALAAARAAADIDLAPEDVPLVLARAKAEAVAANLPAGIEEPIVLGCDSVLEVAGSLQGKPHTPETARERWRTQRGRSAQLHSGHWLVDLREHATPAAIGATASTRIEFADVTDAQIDAYVATGEPLEVAGAFTIDGRGAAFVDRIDGDPSCVIGLSVPLLRELLGRIGVDLTDLWAPQETRVLG